MPRIRPASADDAAAIAAVYAPYVQGTAISFELVAPDELEMAGRMNAGSPRLPWLVAEGETTGGERAVVGFAYASPFRTRPAYQWSVEVSVYVSADSHRRGIGRELYRVLLDELRSLGYVMAFAGIALPNEASVRLHEGLGFRAVGVYPRAGHKLGRWHDVGWWSLALVDPPPERPDPPRTWGE